MGSPVTKLQLRYPTRASQVDQPSTLRRHAILSKTDPQGPNTNDLKTQSRDKKRICALDWSSHIRMAIGTAERRSVAKRYVVCLTPEQRERLGSITRNGLAPAKKIRHAQVLLWSDARVEGGRLSSREVAERLDMHVNTVDRIRKRFVLEGEEPALNRKIRETPAIPPKIDGRAEAHLIAICCGPSPEGRTRWTLRLLAGELKRNGLVTSVCVETVRKALKKTNCSLGASGAGVSRSAIRRVLSPKWKTSSTSTRRSTRRKNR
jgi:transposase